MTDITESTEREQALRDKIAALQTLIVNHARDGEQTTCFLSTLYLLVTHHILR